MADNEGLFESPEFQNYVLVQQAFTETAKELHEYVDKKLKVVHEDVYTKCSKYKPCNQHCSETWKETHRWCDACKRWKKNLTKYNRPRGRQIYWDKMHSWEWPQNYRELGRVFGPQYWKEGKLNDLPTYLEIIKNCTEFKLSSTVLDQVKEIQKARNNYTGHNPSSKLSENDKNRVFYMLNKFISAAEISREINSSSLLQVLYDIQKGNKIQWNPKEFNQIKKVEAQKQETKYGENGSYQLQLISNNLGTQQYDIEIIRKEVKGRRRDDIFLYRKVAITGTIVFIFTVLTFAGLFTRTGKDSLEGCLSEDFSHPLRPELYLFQYLNEHQKLVGRQWLLQNISETILKEDFYHTGVLLVADMGFGKSALVSHIVCADSDHPGAQLRAKLLAYHICRFDAFNTKRADLFIRRLAGMIANSIPQFGSALETEYGVLGYLNSTTCNYDPVGCMDQSIVSPLSKIEQSIDKKQRMIIMIDGLDECEDTENTRNEILSVLERSAYRFPAWIKFIVTSRNIPSIVRKMGDFHIIQASANDTRNGKDIYDFINKFLEKDQTTVQTLLKAWIFDEKMDVINKLVEMSSGNFLYVHHALRYLKFKDILSMQNIPNSLDKIYQLNFERIYGIRESRFQWARKVLEVLSASKSPIKKENIFKIINSQYTNLSRDMYDVEMHSLMHFVTYTADECVFFTHISIYHWLTDIKRKSASFFIDKEKGHYLIARYLFSIVKVENNNSDTLIIDLAVHVSESKREDLVIYFKSLPPKLFNGRSNSTSLLHKLACQVNSYFATELCLHFVKEVDSRNEDDVTPAFIAAGKGNVYTLQALLDAGANISFRRQLPKIYGSLEDAVLITKTRTFWGYGLLDIAAQHGRVDTTHLLLTRNRSLADAMNEINVKPHHLACEFGHIKVLDEFFKFGPQFADQRCLYNAASNGHQNIVQKLLNLDVKDSCVPCNGSMYWVGVNENRLQAEHLTVDFPKGYFGIIMLEPTRKPFDDWWTISCETALHAASRLGFTNIVQLLTAQGQNAMSCRDRAGRTPFLSAIIYNRTETIDILYPLANLSDKCLERGLTDEQITQLSKLEIQKLSEGKCPNGLSVVHLIATYGLANLARSSLFRALDWEEKDNEGNRPIHHAACHSGIVMINTLSIFLHVDLFSRTPNGSTAFHLAALCRPFNLIGLHDKNVARLPQLYDIMNRSILQYMYISPLPSVSSNGIQRDVDRRVLMERLFSAEDVTHMDCNSANILHSIIGNGYFVSMINVYLKYQNEFLRLIRRNNIFKRTPLDEAFYNLPNDNFVVRKPHNSLIDQVLLKTFSNINEVNFLPYLSPIEQSILYFARIISQHTEHHQFFGKYVHDAIKKSNVYVTLMFILYMKAHDVLDFRGYSPLHTFMSIGNNPFMAEIFLANSLEIIRCGLPLEKSPLHQISLNINNSFWFVDSVKMQELLKGLTPAYLDQCCDAEGYNIFHRAVEGGNYELAKYFIDEGLLLTENEKLISEYIMLGAMAKFSFYKPILQHYELQVFDGSKHWYTKTRNIQMKTNYDLTLLLFLRKFNEGGYLTCNHICNASAARLSLVHLAAANGLTKSLEYINNSWGKQALFCRNVDLISPLYLSHVFHQHKAIQYFEMQNVSLHFPKYKTEMFLSVILFHDIGNIKHENINCLKRILRYYRQINDFSYNLFALFREFRYLNGLQCSKLLPISKFYLTSLQNASSQAFVQVLDLLTKLRKLRSDVDDFTYARKLQAISKLVYKTYKINFAPLIKIVFSDIFCNEMFYLESKFMSDWFFDHLLHIFLPRHSKFGRFSLYVEVFSSVIDQKSQNNFTYLNILTRIGGYREMETNEDLLPLNITTMTKQEKRKLIFPIPKVIPEVLKPLKGFSNFSDVL